jgi:pimeloyl-ACP methyl ester carboxylesterase
MNASEMTWVSGWASDISIWENEIYERFPFSHRFVDYWDLISDKPDNFWDSNPRIAESQTIVGWSMATLALLRNLHKKPAWQKWVLICPIADFCGKGCWQLPAVRTIKRGILGNAEQTLLNFSALMGAPEEAGEKWVENAMRYSPEQLIAGLDYLIEKKVDVAEISGNELNIEFVFGKEDRVLPLAQKELFASLFTQANAQVTIYENLGHWLPDYFKRPLAGA